MRGVERQEQIKGYIQRSERVTVAELSDRWDITPETVRRDLDKLEEKGFIVRVHGGAIWNEMTSQSGAKFIARQKRHTAEKRAIAQKAARLVARCSSISVDASSTTLALLDEVGHQASLKVISNSCTPLLNPDGFEFEFISSGGLFNRSNLAFQGEAAAQAILRYHVDLAFIGCVGLNLKGGVTDSNEDEIMIKRAIIKRADKVAVLADHTKFKRTALLDLLNFSEISYLVTDEMPDQAWVDRCADADVELIY